jgi:hypothetical protein
VHPAGEYVFYGFSDLNYCLRYAMQAGWKSPELPNFHLTKGGYMDPVLVLNLSSQEEILNKHCAASEAL